MSDPVARLNAALEGRYAIERELGEGGMATVYLADDLKHQRKVALKVLKPELAAVVGAERFLAEIKTTANLTHPHILPLFDSGEADSFLFYVMPHIEGESLRERIDREKQLGVQDSVAITQKVAGALEYAHQHGVVHRDIKPGNILLSEQGEPLVADFGIALAVAQAGAGRITETGLSLGTPHYMSPEQATGDRDVDPRSDVYALGCVLYEMLAGQPPFSATTAQAVLVKILTVDAPSITSERRTVPPHVGAALAQALEKLPADRFTSAAEFAAALTDPSFTYEARARTSVAASEPMATPTMMPGLWNRLTIATTAVAVLLAGLAAWGWLRPAAPLTVTRASIRMDDFSFRPLGEIMLSPDGSRVVLAGLLGDAPIHWRNADEENFRPIAGTEGAEYAAFSPDGQTLVFGPTAGGTIYRVAMSGGAPQPVADLPAPSVGGIDWGDDGNVLFTLNQGRGLFRVPATGGEPEELLEPAVRLRNPKFLPGSRSVIFTDLPTLSTHLLDLETDSVRVLRAGAIDAVYVQTGHLLYTDVAGTLWAVPFDPREGEVRGEAVIVFEGLTKPQAAYARFSVSRNGTLVYGAGLSGVATGALRLGVVDLEGNEDVLVLGSRVFANVKWSPDGLSVAYDAALQVDANPHLFIYNVELGTTPRQLTFEGVNVRPVFSPDGTRVTFSSIREGTDGFDLFEKTLGDDAPARSLITLAGHERPTQWPSDTLIVFEQGSDLWMLDLSDPDNPSAEVYLPLEAVLDDIVVSGDGTLAAYVSDETGRDEVYIRSFPEPGGRTPVSQGGGSFPRWAPDDNTVYYWTGSAVAGGTLWAARIQREPTPVVLSRDSLFTGPYGAPNYDLHPDGDRIVVPTGSEIEIAGGGSAQTERFLIVTNFFEELRQRMGSN